MTVLYSDRSVAAVIKPVGLDSENDVPQKLKEQLGGEIYPVHRLDKNVGGVMVYARTKQAAAELSRLIQAGKMNKEYLALVHGTPPQSGEWEDLLWKDPRKNKVYVVDRLRAGVKAAKLDFERLSGGETSLVRVRLHTGRSHQIRVQFASRGFPLVGDHKYGSRAPEQAPRLFSCRISFPYGEKEMVFEASPSWAE